MIFIKFCFFVGIVCALFLLPSSVRGDSDDEDTLLQGLNSYRQSMKLSTLAKNEKADCLADQIARDMEHKPCTPILPTASPTSQITQSSDYPDHLNKCKIDPKSTTDGVILPVCVRKLVPTLVLRNYTNTTYTKYLNDPSFTGAGLGSEDDWMVLVLSTNTPTGIYSRGVVSYVPCNMVLLFGFWFFLLFCFGI